MPHWSLMAVSLAELWLEQAGQGPCCSSEPNARIVGNRVNLRYSYPSSVETLGYYLRAAFKSGQVTMGGFRKPELNGCWAVKHGRRFKGLGARFCVVVVGGNQPRWR